MKLTIFLALALVVSAQSQWKDLPSKGYDTSATNGSTTTLTGGYIYGSNSPFRTYKFFDEDGILAGTVTEYANSVECSCRGQKESVEAVSVAACKKWVERKYAEAKKK